MTLAPEQIAGNWDAAVAVYDEFVNLFLCQYAADALRLVNPRPGQRVLDVAAGTGSLSIQAARAGAEVLAVDFSPGMIEYLRKRVKECGLSNVRAEIMDGQALGIEDASFDAAFSVFGLIFFPDRAAGFRELRRVLKPGGRAAIVAWSSIDRNPLIEVMTQALHRAVPGLTRSGKPPLLLSLAARDKLREEMMTAGFRYVNMFSVTHVCALPSPEWMSRRMHALSPAIMYLFDGLTAEQRSSVSEAYVEILRSSQGEGPHGLEAEAHIAVGVR